MRLNGALSILLVALMVLGGMASLSSLQMGDASAADESNADASSSANSDRDAASGSPYMRIAGLDDCSTSGILDRVPVPFALDRVRTEGRLSDDPNHGDDDENDEADGHDDEGDGHGDDESDAVDYHLPDYITVHRTATGGYVIRIVNDEGVLREEVLTAEEFAEFLEEYGWNAGDEVDEEEHDWVDEEEHDWVTDEWVHDWVDEEEVPEIRIEILDDGTIIVVREFGDEIEYDIIRTDDDGKTTIIRVTPWDTEVIHPQPPQRHRGADRPHGDRDGGGGMQPLLSFADDMSEEERERCKEMLAQNRPDVEPGVAHPDLAPRERTERD
jgi:hypothetical protein